VSGENTALTDFQIEAARLFFALPASDGFLLAGGAALLAQHLTMRPTQDLAFFTQTIRSSARPDAHISARSSRESCDRGAQRLRASRTRGGVVMHPLSRCRLSRVSCDGIYRASGGSGCRS